jgi:hypothetical protein
MFIPPKNRGNKKWYKGQKKPLNSGFHKNQKTSKMNTGIIFCTRLPFYVLA